MLPVAASALTRSFVKYGLSSEVSNRVHKNKIRLLSKCPIKHGFNAATDAAIAVSDLLRQVPPGDPSDCAPRLCSFQSILAGPGPSKPWWLTLKVVSRRCVPQRASPYAPPASPCHRHRAGNREIGDARLDDREPVIEIDLLDHIEFHHGKENAVLERQSAA